MSYFSASIGKKQIMAIAGLAWCGFLVVHMLGNLLLLVGAESYNEYSHKLTSNPLLIVAEAGLVAALLIHMYYALKVTLENRAARPVAYAVNPQVKGQATVAARTMALSGTLILVFIVSHLITFKYGAHYDAEGGTEPIRDLYRLVQEVFQSPYYVLWYVFALGVLFLHLSHALFSSLQTLSWIPSAYLKRVYCWSYIFGFVVSVGFVTGPLYFFFLANLGGGK